MCDLVQFVSPGLRDFFFGCVVDGGMPRRGGAPCQSGSCRVLRHADASVIGFCRNLLRKGDRRLTMGEFRRAVTLTWTELGHDMIPKGEGGGCSWRETMSRREEDLLPALGPPEGFVRTPVVSLMFERLCHVRRVVEGSMAWGASKDGSIVNEVSRRLASRCDVGCPRCASFLRRWCS